MSDQRAAMSLRRTTGWFTICQPYRRRAPAPPKAFEFCGVKFRTSRTVPAHG